MTVDAAQPSLDRTGISTDIDFYFDPICPWTWMASKWVRIVAEQRALKVNWKFMSLRLINAEVDYEAVFPEGYETGHTGGLRLIRVAARVRERLGADAVGPLYRAIGIAIFDTASEDPLTSANHGTRAFVEPILDALRLPLEYADALDDETLDTELLAETNEAIALAGEGVGTPILHFGPPDGPSFFGPVISRLPSEDEAVRLFDHVLGLATYAGFFELKRAVRERPQLERFVPTQCSTGPRS